MSISYLVKVTVTFLATLIGISGSVEDILEIHRRGRNIWERYGAPVLLALRGAVEHYMQLDYLLGASNEDLMGYRDSYLLECNMVAVAAAIISQIALTALQFQAIHQFSWTARAAFVFSLVSGCFSVYAACTQQRLMTNLTRPDQLRAWLTADPEALHSEIRIVPGARQNSGITKVFSDGSAAQPSLPTVLTLTAPRTLLDCSVRCFLVGLGIYLASVWANNNSDLQSSKTSNLWTMNTYFIALCVGLSLFISPSSYKNFSKARDRETRLQMMPRVGEDEKPWHHESGLDPKLGKGFEHVGVEKTTGAMANALPLGGHNQAAYEIEKALRASAASHQQSARELLAAADMVQRLLRNG